MESVVKDGRRLWVRQNSKQKQIERAKLSNMSMFLVEQPFAYKKVARE